MRALDFIIKAENLQAAGKYSQARSMLELGLSLATDPKDRLRLHRELEHVLFKEESVMSQTNAA